MKIEEWEGEILKEERIVFKFGPVLTGRAHHGVMRARGRRCWPEATNIDVKYTGARGNRGQACDAGKCCWDIRGSIENTVGVLITIL